MKIILAVLIFLSSYSVNKPIAADVYICDSPKATVYHQSKTCSGLQHCKHEIKTVSLDDAIKVYGRRACKICY